MRNETFSPEILRRVRQGLPQGAQKELAGRYGVSQRDIHRILQGYNLRSGKCNIYAVLNDAMEMFIEIDGARAKAKRLAETITNDSM